MLERSQPGQKERPIKIVRVIARLNIGGPAIHTILLSSMLNGKGYRDILVAGSVSESEGTMDALAAAKHVSVHVIPELGREISLLKDMKALAKLYRIMIREKPDIVHTHTAKAGTLGRIAAILAGVPVKVHTFHGHIFDGYFSPVKARLFLWIERALALFTHRLITVSEAVRNDIVYKLKICKPEKCVVIPLGLELDRFIGCDSRRGEFRSRFGLPKDAAIVGIVGRLVPIKNHKMFLDAAKRIKERSGGNTIKFVIVGDGESRVSLKEYADRIGVSGDVIFAGWVDDLASVYADLDIVTLTSLNEGTPVSLIEAMAAGRAIVATDVGGVRDLLKDNTYGVLVRSDDVSGFADAVVSLIGDGERREIYRASSPKAVMSRYSKERLGADIRSMYAHLLMKRWAPDGRKSFCPSSAQSQRP